MIHAQVFLIAISYQIRKSSPSKFDKSFFFKYEWMLHLPNAFSTFTEIILIFLLYPANVKNIDWYTNTSPTLPSWSTMWSFPQGVVHQDILHWCLWDRLPIIFLSCNGFVGYWYQDYAGLINWEVFTCFLFSDIVSIWLI